MGDKPPFNREPDPYEKLDLLVYDLSTSLKRRPTANEADRFTPNHQFAQAVIDCYSKDNDIAKIVELLKRVGKGAIRADEAEELVLGIVKPIIDAEP